MDKESWKGIPGYEDLYEASDQGRVRSLLNETGPVILSYSFTVKKQKGRDYIKPYVTLRKDSKLHRKLVSRIIFRTFKGEIPKGYHIDHINNDPTDNRLENLQELTCSENLKKRFVDNPSLLTGLPKKAVLCKETGKIYRSLHEASRETGIHRVAIRFCCNGSGKYKSAGGYHWKFI